MSSNGCKGFFLSECRTAGGPGDIDSDEFNSYDLDSEEYSPDDYESDFYEDEVGELIEDRLEDMLDDFQ